MTPLTPLDVETLKLRTSLRGYDRGEVDSFHGEVIASIEEYVDHIARLKLRVRELEGELTRYREQEDGVKNSLMLAQRTADELVSAARERAEALLQQAKGEAQEVRRSIADITSQREQFEYQFHGLLSGFIRRLEQANPQLTAELTNSRANTAAPAVSSSMDTQQTPQPEDRDIQIDMEDLTVQPMTHIEPEPGGGETVIMPMAQPPQQNTLRADLDSADFNAALESVRPESDQEQPEVVDYP